MPKNRFQANLKSSRVFDHAQVDTTDRLYKIRVIIDKVLCNISKLVTPNKYLSLDEPVLPWRGRSLFRQYLKHKSHKYGIKLYVLTTSDGFILNFLLYSGKGTIVSENSTHTAEVVKQLMMNYLNKGYWVFMDKYYNSVRLADYLVKNKTYVTGTLDPKRKDNPKSLIKIVLKKGEAAIKRKGPVLDTSLRDKRYVRMITTGHKHQMIEVTNRRGVKSTVTDPSTPSDHKDGTQHYLEPIPDTAKNSTVMRRCKKCANRQIRKQSRYLFPLCPGMHVCVHPCFREWHEK
ncbi:hypothetical protein JTB14_021655 [Gonioctena quinquepunctata]|nr:hypothetical protein JTB14_021655 [Gonioctena quinquepunctata]